MEISGFKPIEKIARGIIMNGGKILLCKNLVKDHYFLPGGHIELGETPEDALRREMIEETNCVITNVQYVTAIKNEYEDKGGHVVETSDIFLAEIDNVEVISKESHLAFEWQPLTALSTINFKPQQSIGAISKAVEASKDFWK